MALASPGIGSNLDINGIISQLMTIERRPLLALNQKETAFQAKLSAYGALRGALSSFQGAVRTLNDVNRFQSLNATVADGTIATAAAANSAVPGNYALEVNQLAQAQKLVAAGQSSLAAATGTGTLTFEFGTIAGGSFDPETGRYSGASFSADGAGAKTVSIDASNATLAGVRDAINAAKLGVTASIVNDGSGSPYRLSLSVAEPGKANSLRISVTGDSTLAELLAHDPAGTQNLTETVSARNAEFKLDGIAISKPSNSVTDAIDGVTLTLAKANPGSPTTITVVRDVGAVRSSVENFVKAYNDLNATIRNMSAYNSATRQGAVLQGDSMLISLQARLRANLGGALSGATGEFRNLSQIGVGFQKDGTLALDAARFQAAIDAAPNDIAALFATLGRPSDAAVRYAGSTSATRAGSYAISVTQLATQGTQTGSAAAHLTISAGVNDAFTVTVDGHSALVTLAAGTYASADDLAREVQSKINGAEAIAAAGATVSVSAQAGVLTLTSARYGADSSVAISSGNALNDLLGPTPVGTLGLDVAGSINDTPVSGAGRFLTDLSSGASSGLRLEITGGPTGERGAVHFSRGYAASLDVLIDGFLTATGAIAARTEGLSASIKSIDNRRQEMERRLADVETRLRAQYTALDQLVGRLSTTSSFLTQQLANLAAQTK